MNDICFIEVNSVLHNMSISETSKIPKNIIETINKKANNQKISIDSNKELEEQISKEALSMLTYIVLKYIVKEEQRKQLKASLIQNQIEYEEKQPPIKDVKEIFKNKEITKDLVIIKKEGFVKRIIKKIIMFFK